MKVLERQHKRRLKAVHKEAAEGARRQKKLLRELGVPDLSPEEITESIAAAATDDRAARRGRRARDRGWADKHL